MSDASSSSSSSESDAENTKIVEASPSPPTYTAETPLTQQQFQQPQQPVHLDHMQQRRLNQLQQIELQQPQQPIVWMPLPQGIPGCPQGLEYLTQVDQLLVHQQIELLEVVTNIEMPNRYQIKNTLGQQCYFAEEESDLYMRNCCGPQRGFQMHLTDNSGREVIRINREFKCCIGCCWCADGGHCSHLVEVEAPPGTVVGKVVQGQSSWAPVFKIFDADDKEIFTMQGPCCICTGPCCTQDIPFDIYAGTVEEGATPIGSIGKQFGGYIREALTNATNFSVTFPMDLDVRMKAVLLGATFLIDFMFFETQPNNNNNNN